MARNLSPTGDGRGGSVPAMQQDAQDPAQLGGAARAKNVIGAMEQCMNGVAGFRRGHARGIAFRGPVHREPEARAADDRRAPAG